MFDRSAAAFAVALGIATVVLLPHAAVSQSAADLSSRIHVDGSSADFSPLEAVFRDAAVCSVLTTGGFCNEEPRDDSRWSALQDVHQVHVTWDARRLYLAVDGRLGGHALLLLLDFLPGGLQDLAGLQHWRRAVSFDRDFRPDAFLAVHDAPRAPELWLVDADAALTRVSLDDFDAVSSFDAEAPGRALEAAIPWAVMFPDAPLGLDPEAGAPSDSMFVLPESASRHGLRLVAIVVHTEDGLSGPDVAPDNRSGMPLDARHAVVVDRYARIAWDATASGPPFFVDFGVAVQTQLEPRFVPELPADRASGSLPLRIVDLRTYARSATGYRPTRLVLSDAGMDLVFFFALEPELIQGSPPVISASVFSIRGERVRDLYRDRPYYSRSEPELPNPNLWDGRDTNGRAVPGGLYVLRVTAGLSPGAPIVQEQRVITVVR